MKNIKSIELQFTGEFSLAASGTLAAKAAFIDDLYGDEKVLDLALLLEGSWKTVGVRVTQKNKVLQAEVFANPSKASDDEIKQQLERMLSLNVDGKGFTKVVSADKVVADLNKLHPGIRPILFASPYEGAARAIIGHQLPLKQAAKICSRIAEAYGVRVDIDGHILYSFPAPNELKNLPYITGLAARKVDQLKILGTKVGDWLSSASLLNMDKEQAMIELQRLPGIGPFSAELIMLRSAGDHDAFPKTEMRLQRAMIQSYNLGENPDIKILEKIADNWRPYRTWVGLLLRNSIPR